MLTKLLSLQHLNNLEYSESEFVKAMIGITTQYHSKVQGSVKQSDVEGSTISKQLKFHNCPTNEIDVSMKEYYILARPLYQKVFDDTNIDHLLKMYEVIYPNTIVSFSRFYFETKNVTINGEEYHSIKCRSKRSAVWSVFGVKNEDNNYA